MFTCGRSIPVFSAAVLIEDDIYEAAFLPDRWSSILHRMAVSVDAEGTLLANPSNPKVPWIASDGVRRLYDDFFEQGWAYDNARTHALLNIPHQGFMSDAQHMSNDWMAQQSIYRDFLWIRGFGYAAGTKIKVPSGDTIIFSVEKRRDLGPVQQHDLDTLDRFRPHLARATLLASRFEFGRIEAAIQALEIAGLPAAMIRDDGKVVNCNANFEAFSPQILIAGRDRLRFRDKAADVFFESFLSAGRAKTGNFKHSHSFLIPAADLAPPAVIHVVPVKGLARDIFLRTAFFLIATPLNRRVAPSEEIIQGLFDLTATEARIGRLLVSGATIRETAVDLGTSFETVRSHVKSILAKSGLHRQGDFVSVVSAVGSIAQNRDDDGK
ncbi:hypothetical protein GOZ83_12735 [Agrobacterium vitis]|nr:helix-turn-helix transcriptional regulator [Allorhizobium ampelinum]MVA45934.1 hypothetical protein [Agrobacterium vitis]